MLCHENRVSANGCKDESRIEESRIEESRIEESRIEYFNWKGPTMII